MTRNELLRIVIGQARSNGFEFRRWYTASLDEPWINAELSVQLLEEHRRYYALLFSHAFARTFWKPGSEMTFKIEAGTFQRRMPDGSIVTIHRKAFIRRSSRRDAWRFHLREMAAAEEPLRYIRRYLHVEEAAPDAAASSPAESVPSSDTLPAALSPAAKSRAAGRQLPLRPLPQELPAFLTRPYEGRSRNSGSA